LGLCLPRSGRGNRQCRLRGVLSERPESEAHEYERNDKAQHSGFDRPGVGDGQGRDSAIGYPFKTITIRALASFWQGRHAGKDAGAISF